MSKIKDKYFEALMELALLNGCPSHSKRGNFKLRKECEISKFRCDFHNDMNIVMDCWAKHIEQILKDK